MEWEKGETATEWLFAEDWVEVDGQVDALDEWSKEGRGVGLVALFTVVACYVSVPKSLIRWRGVKTESNFRGSLYRS